MLRESARAALLRLRCPLLSECKLSELRLSARRHWDRLPLKLMAPAYHRVSLRAFRRCSHTAEMQVLPLSPILAGFTAKACLEGLPCGTGEAEQVSLHPPRCDESAAQFTGALVHGGQSSRGQSRGVVRT